ncbi:Zn 2cys6 transcription factor [Penicillium macrosclerotiorum]|uniref:Zn 2cys6 transcription factor n=1 Tax=Penicillium macrosclerotiorum TaxID=303699 RepID=UPI0025481446|nr:Zn 2cys6 transcription factor [Penicillium macrosclerotiorum]KAJ5698492.1 Zn 2cys6 transcription factor [Penicillium macrosclerotiorum]
MKCFEKLRNPKASPLKCDTNFYPYSMTFLNGVILLHRPDLRKGDFERNMANQHCRDAAFQITAILKTLTQTFGHSIPDSMVVYSTLSAGLIHMIALQSTDASFYRRSLRALKSIISTLAQMMPHIGYAKVAYDDLRSFAMKWSLSPANSPAFWSISNTDTC